MKLLETSFLVDYERGRQSALRYFRAHEHADFTASTVSMFELGFGVVWDGNRELDSLRESLRWVDFLDFSVTDALEGATIQSERKRHGDRIPLGEMLVAGVARNRDPTLVAGADHFDRIADLSVENHRTW